MKKIPTLFVRNPDDRRYVTDAVTPGCEWVLAGEGVATRKYDGTCVMLDQVGRWWARREVKPGREYPDEFVLVECDAATGKTVGWEPASASPFARYLDEAIAHLVDIASGTYELVGPKINGNPEKCTAHRLVRHFHATPYYGIERTFDAIRDEVLRLHREHGHEGVVWHHPDGRMAKIKARDFKREE